MHKIDRLKDVMIWMVEEQFPHPKSKLEETFFAVKKVIFQAASAALFLVVFNDLMQGNVAFALWANAIGLGVAIMGLYQSHLLNEIISERRSDIIRAVYLRSITRNGVRLLG